MARSKASNEAQYRYNASHLKRVPLDMQLSDYEVLRTAASTAGESVNGYIKRAIFERIERDEAMLHDQTTTGGGSCGAPAEGT